MTGLSAGKPHTALHRFCNSSPNVSPCLQCTCTGADEITAPNGAIFYSFQQEKQDCDDLRARPTLYFHRKIERQREENGHFPWGQTSFWAYFARRWSCGDSWAAQMWQLCLRSAVETQDNKICLHLLGKVWGLQTAPRCRRGRPCARRDAPMIWTLRVFAFTSCAATREAIMWL